MSGTTIRSKSKKYTSELSMDTQLNSLSWTFEVQEDVIWLSYGQRDGIVVVPSKPKEKWFLPWLEWSVGFLGVFRPSWVKCYSTLSPLVATTLTLPSFVQFLLQKSFGNVLYPSCHHRVQSFSWTFLWNEEDPSHITHKILEQHSHWVCDMIKLVMSIWHGI